MTTVTANPAIQETGIGFNPELAPIGSMEAQDPLALTAREADIVASWDNQIDAPAEGLEPSVAEAGTPEEEAQKGSGVLSGLRESVYSFARKHPRIAQAAVALGAIGAVGAVDAAPAMASHTWSVLGGDPLVKGGVHSKKGLDNLLHSSKGQKVMHGEGLNDLEVKAIQDAADEGDIRNCELKTGDHFKAMGFGSYGEVEDDVTYTSYNAPAYCVDVKVHENGRIKTINVKIPKKCANIALYREFSSPVHHPHHPKPHHPKKPTAPVYVAKDAIAANGQPLKYVPSDTFEFFGSCIQHGRKVTKDMVLNEGPNQAPQFLLRCDVNKGVKVVEKPTLGPDQWISLSNNTQSQTVRPKGNLFAFKDQEVQPGTPPPTHTPTCEEEGNCPPVTTTPQPPTVEVEQKTPGFEGGDELDQIVICATADAHPATDGLTVTASDKYTGPLSVYQVGSTDEYCAKDTLPGTPETDDDVTFTATDNANHLSAHDDTGEFPVRQPQ